VRLGRALLRTASRGAAECRQRSEREDGEQSAHADTLEARAVGHAVRRHGGGEQREESCRDEDRENCEIGQASFGHLVTSFRKELEADVLQSVGSLAVQPSSSPVVAPLRGQVTLRDPG
jgi:hypothetical protein